MNELNSQEPELGLPNDPNLTISKDGIWTQVNSSDGPFLDALFTKLVDSGARKFPGKVQVPSHGINLLEECLGFKICN